MAERLPQGAWQPDGQLGIPETGNAGVLIEALQLDHSPGALAERGTMALPGGMLSSALDDGSQQQQQQRQHPGQAVVVVHVQEGSQHQALLYLLRSVSRHFRLDDLLPSVPEEIAAARFLLLGEPGGPRRACRAKRGGHVKHMWAPEYSCWASSTSATYCALLQC